MKNIPKVICLNVNAPARGKIKHVLRLISTSFSIIQTFQILIGDSKSFQTTHGGKVECLDISNVVNIKVVEFFKIQPHEG